MRARSAATGGTEEERGDGAAEQPAASDAAKRTAI
jgi:hypothetical protein